MSRTVSIVAPSRLHFGLWSLGGHGGARAYGGVGAMIAQPALSLVIEPAERFEATGPVAGRARRFAERWAEFHGRSVPACRIAGLAAPPEHTGLGSGTQLGLAVAAGLSAFCDWPAQAPVELALSVGRGLRSAVGTYGFVHGGLIVEQGKVPHEPISPLDCRIDMPGAWRFVLVRPLGLAGLAGNEEESAIASLPAAERAITEQLIAEVRERLVPAAATADFDAFARSLFNYGYRAGELFSARQGGPYNGPLLTRIVALLRRLGAVGVGQSSWGPTLFAVQPDQAAAEGLVARLQAATAGEEFDISIAAPANRGAAIHVNERVRRPLGEPGSGT